MFTKFCVTFSTQCSAKSKKKCHFGLYCGYWLWSEDYSSLTEHANALQERKRNGKQYRGISNTILYRKEYTHTYICVCIHIDI